MIKNEAPESPDVERVKVDETIRTSADEMERRREGTSKEQAQSDGSKTESPTTSENGDGDGLKSIQLRGSGRQLREITLQKLAAIAAILAFLVAAPAYILSYMGYMKALVGNETGKTQILVAGRFVVTRPSDGSDVAFTDVVSGKTPLPPDMNHYILVTSPQGSNYVQDTPATVAGATFTGWARFGETTAGQGENFIVRVLATRSGLIPGPLTTIPEDAVFSDPVRVRRR